MCVFLFVFSLDPVLFKIGRNNLLIVQIAPYDSNFVECARKDYQRCPIFSFGGPLDERGHRVEHHGRTTKRDYVEVAHFVALVLEVEIFGVCFVHPIAIV